MAERERWRNRFGDGPDHEATQAARLARPGPPLPFAALNADARVREFYPRTLTSDESAREARSIGEHFRQYGFGLWAVEVIDGPPFAGYIGLTKQTFDAPFTPCVEVGWRLAYDTWGRGHATE